MSQPVSTATLAGAQASPPPLPASYDIGSPADRALVCISNAIARQFIASIDGLHHVDNANDPFILAANHCSRREALILPPILFARRGGRRIHFVADWNFQLIPGIGWLNRRAEVITTTRKPARPRFLSVLKTRFADEKTVLARARTYLEVGRSVGIFPEGTVNRDSNRLLIGRRGAARLSLETGVPIVPVGIRFEAERNHQLVRRLVIRIGAPIDPRQFVSAQSTAQSTQQWHAVVMQSLSRLSGKSWPPDGGRKP